MKCLREQNSKYMKGIYGKKFGNT